MKKITQLVLGVLLAGCSGGVGGTEKAPDTQTQADTAGLCTHETGGIWIDEAYGPRVFHGSEVVTVDVQPWYDSWDIKIEGSDGQVRERPALENSHAITRLRSVGCVAAGNCPDWTVTVTPRLDPERQSGLSITDIVVYTQGACP